MPTSKRIQHLHEADVVKLQGSNAAAQHIGNILFYEMVEKNVKFYYSSTSFLHKKEIKNNIYQQVLKKGGNFYQCLYHDNSHSLLYLMDKKEAFQYISICIRRKKKDDPSLTAAKTEPMEIVQPPLDGENMPPLDGENMTATKSFESTNTDQQDSYTVEVGNHPDPNKNFEVTSVVATNYDDTKELATFLFVSTVLKEMTLAPTDWLVKYFYKMCPSTPYIKTRRIHSAKDFKEYCPSLALLIDQCHKNDLDIYFQFYTGTFYQATRWLTSIHQDSIIIKITIWRILVRVFGGTAFFSSKYEDNLFYLAGCEQPRAILSTMKAFTGTCEDGSNNGVYHAAVKDTNGLPGFVAMVESKEEIVDINTAKATMIIFEKVCIMHYVNLLQAGVDIPTKAQLTLSLKEYDEKLFNPEGGIINYSLDFAPTNAIRHTKAIRILEEQFQEPAECGCVYAPEHNILSFRGGGFNPNIDMCMKKGGSLPLREKFTQLIGNQVWNRLLATRLLEQSWSNMKVGEKGKFLAALMVEFHTETGGWFWTFDNYNLRRLSVEELLHSKSGNLPKLRGMVKTFLSRPENQTLHQRQLTEEKERAKSVDVGSVVDLGRLCQEDQYAAELSNRAGAVDTNISIDVVRAILLALGMNSKSLSKAEDPNTRKGDDLKEFQNFCTLPALIRPHAFKSRDFLIDFAVNKLDPPCPLHYFQKKDKKKKCIKIIIIIVIQIIVQHLKEHPNAVVRGAESAT